jgi:hypothetical protein
MPTSRACRSRLKKEAEAEAVQQAMHEAAAVQQVQQEAEAAHTQAASAAAAGLVPASYSATQTLALTTDGYQQHYTLEGLPAAAGLVYFVQGLPGGRKSQGGPPRTWRLCAAAPCCCASHARLAGR